MKKIPTRAERISVTKAYIVEHDDDSLPAALADPSSPQLVILAALLHACGYDSVSADDGGAIAEFFAGPTPSTGTLQLTFNKNTLEVAGPAAPLMNSVYSLLSAIEHELGTAIYLPPDMRYRRVQSVCNRLGVEEGFFQAVLRNSGA